jgi:hypothetical protein
VSKPIPPYMTFQQAMSNGYVERMENDAYRRYVRQLPCSSCNAPADDPHHIYTTDFSKGMATKVPDYWCLPLCRHCHDELHRDVAKWEHLHGSQWMHALLTVTQAIHEKVIRA